MSHAEVTQLAGDRDSWRAETYQALSSVLPTKTNQASQILLLLGNVPKAVVPLDRKLII